MTQPLDLTRPVQTRDGRKVRILCTDRRGPAPIVGIVECASSEATLVWQRDGSTDRCPMASDLVNVPEPEKTVWVNVYGTHAAVHKDREEADRYAGTDRFACLEARPGQGLDRQ